MARKRVVVTGMGVISPVGLTVPSMWEALLTGRSGIGQITLFDAEDYPVQIAGEVWGFDPMDYLSAKEARRTDRHVQFALAAFQEVQEQANLEVKPGNEYNIGVIVGSGIGGIWMYTHELDVLQEKGPRRINPFLVPSITGDASAVQIAMRTGARGPNFAVSSACSTGADAIGLAYETICRGDARAMFAGGFEAAVAPIGLAAFAQMRALSRRNHDPEGACRPFDSQRDGFVLSEGGAMMLLEELDFALARGAVPLAELIGYAATSDAIHLTAPDPQGNNAAHCMTLALRKAGITPEQVSYINAHGTGTPLGDPAETEAIKRAFGEHAHRVPVSSSKSMTGHLLSGSGALEAVVCVQALRGGVIPPTINLETPDPDCDLDYVPNQMRQVFVEVALSNSIGFGGHNATLVFRRVEDV